MSLDFILQCHKNLDLVKNILERVVSLRFTMIEDLFSPYHSHLPQHIQDEVDEDEVFMLRSDIDFEDLITDGTNNNRRLTFQEFYSFVKKRVVFVTPDTAISGSLDTPSHHKYTIDAIFTFPTATTIQRTLHVSGVNAQETSPALNFLLRLVLESESNETNTNDEGKIINNNNIKVILKCFPTTPRQQLGSLDLSSPLKNLGQKRKISSLTQSPPNAIDIDFRFLALEKAHCQLIFNENSNIFSCVKLSQCEIDGWMIYNPNDEEQKSHNSSTVSVTEKTDRLPQKLVLSCTRPEFRKFAEGRLLTSNETSICELHLVLHFMLADSDVDLLESIIQNSKSLKSLRIEFLDLDDNTWKSICKSLHDNRNLKGIQLAHTENFADSYRRLTPECRHSRTNDILQLLTINKTLQEFDWPKFQQDESLIPNVERLLVENKRTSSSVTEELPK